MPQPVVNPQDPASFTGAKLRWSEREERHHCDMLALYRQLLRLRREQPDLADPRRDRVEVDFDEDAQWIIVHRGAFDVLANLADHAQPLPAASGDVLFGTEPDLHAEGLQITLPARTDDGSSFYLHGLVALHLQGHWHRPWANSTITRHGR